MKAYKYTDGTNEKFFDVLYIEDDGTMTLEHHNSERTVSFPAQIEGNKFGQVVKTAGGSIFPFTDKKGNMLPRWSELTAEQVAEMRTSDTRSEESVPDTPAGTETATSASSTSSSSSTETDAGTPAGTATGRTRGRRKADDDYGRVVVPTGTESPSEGTETAAGEESPTCDEQEGGTDGEPQSDNEPEGGDQAVRTITDMLRKMMRGKAAKEIAKGVGIITALAIIWQTGLLIPFALLGGVAAGVVK